MREDVRLAKARAGAFARTSQDRVSAATSIADPATRDKLKMVVKPPNMAGSMRKVGTALLIAPDPFTGVAGAALWGASFVVKRREAANLESLAKETARTMRTLSDLRSLL